VTGELCALTVLFIEEYNKSCSYFSDILIFLFYDNWTLFIHQPRWEKRLLLCLTINTLNAYRILLYFPVFLETTDIFETVPLHVLVDSEATRVFINRSSMEKYCLNIHKLFKSILVYNVNGISNEARQISEVVDIRTDFAYCI